jgi:hypothetical protein
LGQNVVVNPTANQDIVQPSGTQLQTNNFDGIRYYDASWNWSNAPGGTLTAGTPATITLASCPRGIDTSGSGSYLIYIAAGAGPAEVTQVTGGSCVGGSSGTITFTPANSHSGSFRIGSASSGIQEMVVDACGVPDSPQSVYNVNAHLVLPATGPGNSNPLVVHGSIFVHCGKALLEGDGTLLQCSTRDRCMVLGDLANSNDYGNITVRGIRFESTVAQDGCQVVSTSRISGEVTITVASGCSTIQTGDTVVVNFLDNTSLAYWGGHGPVTVSGTSIMYPYGTGNITSQPTPGTIAIENAAVEDNALPGTMDKLEISSVAGGGAFNEGLVIDNDQAATIRNLNYTPGGLLCDGNHCGSAVYSAGNTGAAPVIWIDKANLGMQCAGNGVTVLGNNTVHITDSVIQGFGLWGVNTQNLLGSYGGTQLDNIYEEEGTGCNAPSSPYEGGVYTALTTAAITSPGSQAVAVTSTLNATVGQSVSISGGGYTSETVNISAVNPGVSITADFMDEHGSGSSVAGGAFTAAGVIFLGNNQPLTLRGGEQAAGQIPVFATGGTTQYNYYIVPHDSAGDGGYGVPLLAGFSSPSSTTTSVAVYWPHVPPASPNDPAGSLTYDVLRMEAQDLASNMPNAPVEGGCNGGTVAACGSVATSVPQCSGLVCSFTDNTVSSSTASYTIQPDWFPILNYWPGGLVMAGYGGQNGANLPAAFADTDLPVTSVLGYGEPSLFVRECLGSPNYGAWISCGEGFNHGNNFAPVGGFLLNNGTGSGDNMIASNIKGRLNFIMSPSAELNTPQHIITLVDSNPALTIATAGHRPPNSPTDTYIGLDNAAGGSAITAGQLAFGSPVAISNYIGNAGDNASFLERLTATAKTFKVPVAIAAHLNQASSGNFAGTCAFSSSTSCSVSYSPAFSSTPIVILTPVNPGTVTFKLNTSGAGGFTIGASASTSVTVNWIAVGNPD